MGSFDRNECSQRSHGIDWFLGRVVVDDFEFVFVIGMERDPIAVRKEIDIDDMAKLLRVLGVSRPDRLPGRLVDQGDRLPVAVEMRAHEMDARTFADSHRVARRPEHRPRQRGSIGMASRRHHPVMGIQFWFHR